MVPIDELSEYAKSGLPTAQSLPHFTVPRGGE